MKGFIDKGYGWPLLVVTLLVSSVVMMGLVVMAARSDGGAQVVDDYYQQAVQWDSLSAVRNQASKLGWHAELELSRSGTGIEGRVIVTDSTGLPVADRDAVVQLRRPQFAQAVHEAAASAGDQPGTWGFSIDVSDAGLWDVQLVLTTPSDPSDVVQFEWRRELR